MRAGRAVTTIGSYPGADALPAAHSLELIRGSHLDTLYNGSAFVQGSGLTLSPADLRLVGLVVATCVAVALSTLRQEETRVPAATVHLPSPAAP